MPSGTEQAESTGGATTRVNPSSSELFRSGRRTIRGPRHGVRGTTWQETSRAEDQLLHCQVPQVSAARIKRRVLENRRV